MSEQELKHYGVKGMKWGVRKETESERKAYKNAKKAYSKSFNKAYNRAIAAYSPIKKHRDANDKRWDDAAEKAEELRKAKDVYKQAKNKARNKMEKNTSEYSKERERQVRYLNTKRSIEVGRVFTKQYLEKNGMRSGVSDAIFNIAGLALDRKYVKDTFK